MRETVLQIFILHLLYLLTVYLTALFVIKCLNSPTPPLCCCLVSGCKSVAAVPPSPLSACTDLCVYNLIQNFRFYIFKLNFPCALHNAIAILDY
jgi:hypothetical protein